MIYNDERPELIRGRIWLALLGLFAAFGVIALFLPNADTIMAAHVFRMAACSTVVVVYWTDAWEAVKKAEPERTDYLIVGIWLSFLSNAFQSLQGIVGRMGGLPSWWLNNDLIAPTLAASVIAAVLHVSAPGAVDGVVPRRNRIAMGVSFGIAVLLMGSLTLAQPDISPWLDRVRPYISGVASGGVPT